MEGSTSCNHWFVIHWPACQFSWPNIVASTSTFILLLTWNMDQQLWTSLHQCWLACSHNLFINNISFAILRQCESEVPSICFVGLLDPSRSNLPLYDSAIFSRLIQQMFANKSNISTKGLMVSINFTSLKMLVESVHHTTSFLELTHPSYQFYAISYRYVDACEVLCLLPHLSAGVHTLISAAFTTIVSPRSQVRIRVKTMWN